MSGARLAVGVRYATGAEGAASTSFLAFSPKRDVGERVHAIRPPVRTSDAARRISGLVPDDASFLKGKRRPDSQKAKDGGGTQEAEEVQEEVLMVGREVSCGR